MPRRDDSLISDFLELVFILPWKVGVGIAAALIFLGLVVMPLIHPVDMVWQMMVVLGHVGLPILGLAVLGVVGAAQLKAVFRRRLLDGQTGLASIRNLEWKEFENLVGEYYRRMGYGVEENDTRGADGGVDIRLWKDGFQYLVQCKQWRVYTVGVKVVREMYGLMTAGRAAGMFIVTSGSFTQEARAFAEGKPIHLVAGGELEGMINSVQSSPRRPLPPLAPVPSSPVTAPPPPIAAAPLVCPKCGKPLVKKTARKGAFSGQDFWACPGYPACRYIRNVEN